MTEHSPELPPRTASAGSVEPAGARILPFERPQSDLQRAIQLRAQEAIEREREREREVRRPQPLKWLIISAIALVPVVLIFGAVDGFLRALHKFNETYQSVPVPPATQDMEPAAPSRPDVVILQQYEQPSAGDSAEVPGAQPGATPRTEE